MAELAPSGGGPNRLFVILAAGLGGLLILGLLAVGVIFGLQRLTTQAPALTPTVIRIAATTLTRALPSATLAPTEIPSPTFVLLSGASTTTTPGSAAAAVTATTAITRSITPGTGTPGTGNLPQTGVGEDLLLFAGGAVLILVVFAARRARSAN